MKTSKPLELFLRPGCVASMEGVDSSCPFLKKEWVDSGCPTCGGDYEYSCWHPQHPKTLKTKGIKNRYLIGEISAWSGLWPDCPLSKETHVIIRKE